jgi:hypothetical protein
MLVKILLQTPHVGVIPVFGRFARIVIFCAFWRFRKAYCLKMSHKFCLTQKLVPECIRLQGVMIMSTEFKQFLSNTNNREVALVLSQRILQDISPQEVSLADVFIEMVQDGQSMDTDGENMAFGFGAENLVPLVVYIVLTFLTTFSTSFAQAFGKSLADEISKKLTDLVFTEKDKGLVISIGKGEMIIKIDENHLPKNKQKRQELIRSVSKIIRESSEILAYEQRRRK